METLNGTALTGLIVLAFVAIERRTLHRVRLNEPEISPGGLARVQQEVKGVWWRQRLGYATLLALGTALLFTADLRIDSLLHTVILLHFGWTALTLAWAEDRRLSALRLGFRGCVWLLALALGRQASLEQCAMIVAGCCAIFLALGVVEDFRFRKVPRKKGYRFGGTLEPTKQAANCAYLLFTVIYLQQLGKLSIAVGAVVGVAALGLLVLTRARGAVWPTVAAAGIALSREYGALVIEGGGWSIAVGALATLAIVVAACFVDWRRLRTLLYLGRFESTRDLNGRVFLWQYAWRKGRRRRLFGFGPGGFWNADRVGHIGRTRGWLPWSGHSLYLDVIVDTGVIGLGFFVALLVVAYGVAWQTASPAGPFMLAILVFTSLHGILESRFGLPQFGAFSFYLLLFALS